MKRFLEDGHPTSPSSNTQAHGQLTIKRTPFCDKAGLVCVLVCERDYTKATERISTNLWWRMRLFPATPHWHFVWIWIKGRIQESFLTFFNIASQGGFQRQGIMHGSWWKKWRQLVSMSALTRGIWGEGMRSWTLLVVSTCSLALLFSLYVFKIFEYLLHTSFQCLTIPELRVQCSVKVYALWCDYHCAVYVVQNVAICQ